MSKTAFLILPFLFVGKLFAQQHEKFEFWISDLDKAAYNRVTYHITSNKIIVKEDPYDFIYFDKNYKKDKVVFLNQLDSMSSIEFYKMALNVKDDSLKSTYTNTCIMDGMIIHFLFEWRDGTKNQPHFQTIIWGKCSLLLIL